MFRVLCLLLAAPVCAATLSACGDRTQAFHEVLTEAELMEGTAAIVTPGGDVRLEITDASSSIRGATVLVPQEALPTFFDEGVLSIQRFDDFTPSDEREHQGDGVEIAFRSLPELRQLPLQTDVIVSVPYATASTNAPQLGKYVASGAFSHREWEVDVADGLVSLETKNLGVFVALAAVPFTERAIGDGGFGRGSGGGSQTSGPSQNVDISEFSFEVETTPGFGLPEEICGTDELDHVRLHVEIREVGGEARPYLMAEFNDGMRLPGMRFTVHHADLPTNPSDMEGERFLSSMPTVTAAVAYCSDGYVLNRFAGARSRTVELRDWEGGPPVEGACSEEPHLRCNVWNGSVWARFWMELTFDPDNEAANLVMEGRVHDVRWEEAL